EKKPSLFPAIDQQNYIPDELHLCLCITDVLMEYKKKMLEKFPVSQFVLDICEKDIEELWQEFYCLYLILHKENFTDQEIDQFEIDAQN
ncbi:9424_t:CDS:2, partial [Funneliformis mosseae]